MGETVTTGFAGYLSAYWLFIIIGAVALVAIIAIIIIICCVVSAKKKKAKAKAETAAQPEAANTATEEPAKTEEKEEVEKAPAAKSAPAKKEAPAKPTSKTYHISKRKDDGMWQIKAAGGSRAIKLFKTQKEAIDYCKTLADNQDANIMIHKEDGSFRKLTY